MAAESQLPEASWSSGNPVVDQAALEGCGDAMAYTSLALFNDAKRMLDMPACDRCPVKGGDILDLHAQRVTPQEVGCVALRRDGTEFTALE